MNIFNLNFVIDFSYSTWRGKIDLHNILLNVSLKMYLIMSLPLNTREANNHEWVKPIT